MASDRIFGAVVIVVALAFFAGATQIRSSFLADPVGSKTFPMLISAAAVICGVVMLLRPDPEPDWPALRTFGALVIATLVLIGYAYTLKPLGFIVPTAVAAAIVSYQIQPRALPALATGIGLSVGLFLLFRHGLGLSLFALPRGMGI